MMYKLLLAPLAMLTAFFFAFSLVAIAPAFAEEHEDTEEEVVEEGLSITVEEHGNRTHVHVYVDGEETDSFFLEDYELDETDEIIAAIAEETDYTVEEVEEAVSFPSDDDEDEEEEDEHEDDEEEHDDEDEHEDEEEHDDDSHGLENAAEKIEAKANSDKEQQMRALLAVLERLIELLQKQVALKADIAHNDDSHEAEEEHEHEDEDEDDHDHEDEDEHDEDEHEDEEEEEEDDDEYAGIHIMADGTIMLGNGEEVEDATITDDDMIELADGTILEPEMDLR